jgi:response regulator of citrate/malate metabolism
VIRALIVEDDFRVAKIHAGFTERVDGFAVAGVVHTAAAALEAAERLRPDLVLLDVFLPDADGLEVQRRLAVSAHPPDVIFLTAMREMATVRAAMRAGALSYLVKPFSFDALRERLVAYAALHAHGSRRGEAEQADIDRLFAAMRRGAPQRVLPKGHSPATAELIVDALGEAEDALSAGEIADRVGVSRATAQRYLSVLADAGELELSLRYGSAGRPEHEYRLALEHVRRRQ